MESQYVTGPLENGLTIPLRVKNRGCNACYKTSEKTSLILLVGK